MTGVRRPNGAHRCQKSLVGRCAGPARIGRRLTCAGRRVGFSGSRTRPGSAGCVAPRRTGEVACVPSDDGPARSSELLCGVCASAGPGTQRFSFARRHHCGVAGTRREPCSGRCAPQCVAAGIDALRIAPHGYIDESLAALSRIVAANSAELLPALRAAADSCRGGTTSVGARTLAPH